MIYRVGIFVSFVISIFLLSSCSDDQIPTDKSIRDFFAIYRQEMEEVVRVCKVNSNIRWIGANNDELSFYQKSGEYNQLIGVESARSILNRHAIRSLSCSRNRISPDKPLISVTIPLYSSGISVSGYSKGIRFFPNVLPAMETSLELGKLSKLNVSGWYIYRSE